VSTTTRDAFLGGRLILEQPATGHRVGTDAALLAAAITPAAADLVFDLGAGIGAVGLAIALNAPQTRVALVEIDPDVSALAAANIAANGLGERVTLLTTDLTDRAARRAAAGLHPLCASHAVMNPPFHRPGSTRASPAAYRASAHIGDAATDDAWTRTAASLLRPGGILAQIHRADALPRILIALAGRFGDVRVLPILPSAAVPATRVLVRAVKGSRAPLVLLPPLVLHAEGGRFTPLAEGLHRGEAAIDWLVIKNNPRRAAGGR
jgi:tRNA1(Val) A37 N6-methylase TrmN6